jgi:subtilisin family serine protease
MVLRIAHSLFLPCLLTGFLLAPSEAFGLPQLSPALEEIQRLGGSPDSLVEVVIVLEDETIRDDIRSAGRNPVYSRAVRIKEVTSRLKSYRPAVADRVEAFLDAHAGSVSKYWVIPAYSATIGLYALDELAQMDGVSLIVPNADLHFESPVEVKRAPAMATSASSELDLMNVPAVWQRGISGKKRLVCSFDTGVEQSHPALADKWRGSHSSLTSAWFSNVRQDTLPYDATGHGTHTMGIMVGSYQGDKFGVAPDAEWITAGVIDQGRSLSTTIADILEAFQWSLNPDGNHSTTDDVPDVILNSWGIPAGLFADCDNTFWQVIDNVEAAGIVTIFAVGNEGPDAQTVRDPADRGKTPYNTFSVGAVDNSKAIAEFSSRGPSRCNPDQIKPEVVAPGVSIRSSTKGGGFAYMSGTSMAAPYIAGLVALCRQYNPDATVSQIKQAFVQAAEDLGEAGEDNTYGYGLINASRVIDFLPKPVVPEFTVTNSTVSDDGVASPGETFELQLTLTNHAGNVEEVVGRLEAIDTQQASVVREEAVFFFGPGGTVAAGDVPYQIVFDSGLSHGRTAAFILHLQRSNGSDLDSVDFVLPVGFSPPGAMANHSGYDFELTVSDFGQYGLGPQSIYYAGGDGFAFAGSGNLLYEAGIVIGRNSLQVSNSIRDSAGRFRPSDFKPVQSLELGWRDEDGGYHLAAELMDNNTLDPVPVKILQESIDYGTVGDNGAVVMRYFLVNISTQALDSLHFGLMVDFDLGGGGEAIGFDESLNLVYQEGDSGPVVGLLLLDKLTSVKVASNGAGKLGFTDAEKFGMISTGAVETSGAESGDMLFAVGTPALFLEPGDTAVVSFAFVAGEDPGRLADYAAQAKVRHGNLASEYRPGGPVPNDFVLQQNYPNPFNPHTTISFSLPSADNVVLDVFNSVGRRVRRLYSGFLPAGNHEIEWDGTNATGGRVASGVYFYRLSASDYSEARKMVLLK